MFKKLNPEVINLLNKKQALLNTFSTESKLNILEIAETGNVKILEQEIEYLNLGGDY